MAEPLRFGEIPGFPPGTIFPDYKALNASGVHRPSVRGIGGRSAEGADSIVLNGGYKDDHDEGHMIRYTGHGGQDMRRNQVTDQSLAASGNAALLRNMRDRLPVRVIRGHRGNPHYSPAAGYRYDGLYEVVEAKLVRSSDGPLVCQFLMRLLRD